MQSAVRNISSTIWDKDIPAMVAAFRAEGVSEFTISEDPCGLLGTLAIFEAHGAKVQGLTTVDTFTKKSAPAILMRLM